MSQTVTQLTPKFQVGMKLDDHAFVSFGPPSATGVSAFHDNGCMPITSVNVGGIGAAVPMFIAYNGAGNQHFSSTGVPTTADYTGLSYKLFAYTGTATFGHNAVGNPTIGGISSLMEIAHGDLISGHLATQPNGSTTGTLEASFKIGSASIGNIDISVAHPAGDLRPFGPGSFTIDGGSSSAIIRGF